MAAGVENGGGMAGGGRPRARGTVLFSVFATLAFLLLVARLGQLQVMEHEDFANEAARQLYGVVRDRDRRGTITDRNGQTLAVSVAAKSCAIDPKVLADAEGAKPEKLLADLKEMFGLSAANVERIKKDLARTRVRSTKDGDVTEHIRFSWIKQKLSDEEWKKISAAMDKAEREASEAKRYQRLWLRKAGEKKVARQPEAEKFARDAADGWRNIALAAEGRYAGIFFPQDYERIYPQGRLASHILGFARPDGQKDGVGLLGMERALDAVLSGIAVDRVVARDARSRALSTLVTDDRGTEGMTVTLTLDSVVQSIVEEELKDAIDKLRREFPEVTAHAVVMDPFTGEILALANYHDFDPNHPAASPVANHRNDVVEAVQEPGSTFKPLLLAASIEEKLARFDEEIDCSTFRMDNGRTVKDIHPYGRMSLLMALTKSSNPAMVRVGLRLGPEKMRKYVLSYGFGDKTESLLSGEVGGRVTSASKWSSYTMGSVPMGYEINVTTLQMAAAYSVIANGGMLPRPNIIKSIYDSAGNLSMTVEPEMRRRVLSAKTAETMRQALRNVVIEGTGRRANIEEYDLGGKTGTANMIVNQRERAAGLRNYSKTRHTANFVALAPWDKPKAVICVSIRETGKYGGEAASPVVAGIARRVLAYWGVPTKNGTAVKATDRSPVFEDPPMVPPEYSVGAPDDENRLEEEVDPRLWEDWIEDDEALG